MEHQPELGHNLEQEGERLDYAAKRAERQYDNVDDRSISSLFSNEVPVQDIAAQFGVNQSIDPLQKNDRVHRRLTPGDEKTMTAQTWSSEGYAKNARFVTYLGKPVLELLAPRPGELFLSLGCGDGVLLKTIAGLGCKVVGVASSAEFVASARKLGLPVVQKSP